jgi:serine/threonine-protein phosphatase 5
VAELFKAQPSLIDVSIPEDSKFTVCGDIHGQFYDLMNIFKLNGLPSTENPFVSILRSTENEK